MAGPLEIGQPGCKGKKAVWVNALLEAMANLDSPCAYGTDVEKFRPYLSLNQFTSTVLNNKN